MRAALLLRARAEVIHLSRPREQSNHALRAFQNPASRFVPANNGLPMSLQKKEAAPTVSAVRATIHDPNLHASTVANDGGSLISWAI